MMKTRGLIRLLAVLGSLAWGADFVAALAPTEAVPLWPDRTDLTKETVQPSKGDDVIRLTDIESPSLQVFPATNGTTPSPAVLVCPGGGYAILAYDKEGTEVATWLNSIGVSAVVLKYSVPNKREAALEDAQRAMGLIRHHAAAWSIDPKRVGVLGFSAGGHLAASLSTRYATRLYSPIDEADGQSCRPDFSVLVYPAYIAKDDYVVAADLVVDARTPPAFIVQTQDDSHYINSSIAYYIALKESSIPSEIHLFPNGGHGYGLRPSAHAVSEWPARCATWFKTAGILE